MASTSTKVVVVIAIVAVIAVAGAVLLMNDDEDTTVTYDIDGALPVLGNADKDYDIDQNDLDIINKIISNEPGYTFSAYEFADANNDQKVTQEDADIVQKIISKEPVRTWVVNTNFDRSTYIDYLDWPAVGAVSAGFSALPMLYKISGVMDFIKGISLSEPYWVDEVLYPELVGMKSIGPNMRQFDVESVKEVKEKTGASVVICSGNVRNADQLKELGMSIIKPACVSNTVEEFTSAMLLMGFTFDYPTQSLEISEWFKQLRAELDAKLDTAKKTTCITLSTGSICKPTSNYGMLCLEAGGDFPQYMKDNMSGSFKYGDWIYQMDDCEYILSMWCASGGNSWFKEGNDKTEYVESFNDYKDTKMFLNDKIAVISFDLPMPLKIMYASVALHPELFTEEWANEKAQEFINKFIDDKIDVSKLDFLLTADEIKALL